MPKQESKCTHLQELPKLPTATELEKLRRNGWKKRRKSKHPKVQFGNGRHPELGWFKIEPEGDTYRVAFKFRSRGKEVSALLSELCDLEELSETRLRFGWLVADLFELDALHLRESIPGPNEAMSESNPYFEIAYDWRRWAIG